MEMEIHGLHVIIQQVEDAEVAFQIAGFFVVGHEVIAPFWF
jgi:hypothetical protein